MKAGSSFQLFPFQEDASDELRAAALTWLTTAATEGSPKYGGTTIPFLGQLRAVTGSGKTPILARTVSGLGSAVVLWTSRSSAVVDQTFDNLNGKYHSLLPAGVQVIKEKPNQAKWHQLVSAKTGLTIWLLTVAAWMEPESAKKGGSADARLNLHRPHQDWAGGEAPWQQLRNLKRPLWIVSDESHNQSAAQLDVLADLRPRGFLMASATPVINDLFRKWHQVLDDDPIWAGLAKSSTVRVQTRDVVDSELLKTTIEVIDFKSGTEENLDGALTALKQLDKAVKSEGATCTPRAVYVVERSNPPARSHEESRPVAIWRYLRSKGVPANSIAIYTDTRVLPEAAERITSLAGLRPRHRHIVFNQALQEGWDDPEAYVCYFDGVTKSFTRIRQIVGRVLRQPQARRYATERLNTATLIINTPADSYESVLSDLKKELRLYAPEDEPGFSPIRIKSRRDPLDSVPVKRGNARAVSLPRLALKAPDMKAAEKKIRSVGSRPWRAEDLDAPGLGHMAIVSLEKEGLESQQFIDVVRSARTNNGSYLRRQIQVRNRSCLNAIHPDVFSGPAFDQSSCQSSQSQRDLSELAEKTVNYFEDRVTYQPDPDPDRFTWRIGEHRPRGSVRVDFRRAAHKEYAVADMNADEQKLARALDKAKQGIWVRNPSTAELGFSIPLPTKVGDSSRFFPDFLWWVNGMCWAIDPTGKHLLNAKVRGKLIMLDEPRVALLSRGRASLDNSEPEGDEGWSLVVARGHLPPALEFFDDLPAVVNHLLEASLALVRSAR